MGAIVDTVYVGPEELSIIRGRYPGCHVRVQSNCNHKVNKYRLIIPGEECPTDTYYEFLLDNGLGMASSCFVGRFSSDEVFRERMRLRIDTIKQARRNLSLN